VKNPNQSQVNVENIDAVIERVMARQRDNEMSQGVTVREAADRYIKDHLSTLRTCKRLTVTLRKTMVKAYGKRKLASLTRADVRALLDPMKAKKQASNFNGHRALFHGFLSFCVSEDLVVSNACHGIKTMKTKARAVTLKDVPLAKSWRASEQVAHGNIIRMLILTGQRRSEIGGLRWDQVDLENATVNIEAEEYKTGVPHSYPLGPIALEIIKACRKYDCDGQLRKNPFVFGKGRCPMRIYWAIKWNLDRATGDIGVKWTLHDLRRSAKTLWGDIGISADIGERLLGHAMPSIMAVYDRGKHTVRKRAAIESWEVYLVAKGIIPASAKVRKKAAAKLAAIEERMKSV